MANGQLTEALEWQRAIDAVAKRSPVVIGARWTPEHVIHRSSGVYFERGIPGDQMSLDAVVIQRALLAKRKGKR
jgi:hypothetical protein